MRPMPLLPALLLLVACARAPAPDARDASSGEDGALPAGTPRAADAASVERPARDLPDRDMTGRDAARDGGTASAARVDGYAGLRFGMDEAAMRAAWRGPALGGGGAQQECHYLSPEGQAAPAVLAFMLEGGRFVRYDVGEDNAVLAAPGGGRIGMAADAVRALHPGIQTLPHKYVPQGSVLRMPLAGGAVLVFETGADGKVSAWRVGLPPQVDYVEGCS